MPRLSSKTPFVPWIGVDSCGWGVLVSKFSVTLLLSTGPLELFQENRAVLA